MRPNQVILTLEDLFSQRRGLRTRGGAVLSTTDSQTVDEVYQQWLLLHIDLGYLSLEIQKAQLGRIVSDLTSRDVLYTLNVFAEIVNLIRLQSSIGFKARLSTVSSHLWYIYKDDVERMSNGDVLAAKRLNQIFSYPLRLTLKDIDLQDDALSAYRETEQNLQTAFPRGIVAALNAIIKRWFKNIDVSDLQFGHGPGAVAGLGRTSIECKYKSLFKDQLTSYAFDYDVLDQPIYSAPDRISQTIFVPKSYKTFRTISMEPATLMYLQQGVWRAIDRHVNRVSYLRNRIGFHDQTRNQTLARRGSIDGSYATIDLSAASDSVSYELVKALFRGTPLLRLIVATRSPQTVLPDGELLKLKKFAPMGSALCFPVETIVFAAICEFVTRQRASDDRNPGFFGDFSVFGDDIIVPSQCSSDVIYYLELLGFSCNSDKSFVDPSIGFRESCGGEYIHGLDITPLRVSRKYYTRFDNVSVVGITQLAVACYERSFLVLRAFFLKKLRDSTFETKVHRTKIVKSGKAGNRRRVCTKKKAVKYIPFFSPTGLLGDNYTNYHTKRRVSSSLQRLEVFATTIVTKTERGDESIAYRHWLELNQKRESVYEAFTSNVGRTESYLQNRFLASRHIDCLPPEDSGVPTS